MKERILDAARELFVKDGFENVSMRKIAAKINYSPAALYRYFKNKEELLLALKQEGMEKFGRMQAHLPELEDPFQRLREGGRIYLDFACAEPEFYELFFNRRAPSFCDPEKWVGKPHRNFMNFKETVRQCIETEVLGDVSVDIAVASLWSSVHGLASLASTGRLQNSMPDLDMDTIFDQVLDFITLPQKERSRQGVPNENKSD
ncbi:TetR/AcrR family transcriptional regulator [Desulfovibrio sp. JC022]|uniref:TetR/AcrR family transcriptional regulator n=1 Tax=Desulfovibrio sp. JC022 TaxID=2593642 RepID=UPI001EF225D7|nr:TetR/AcrR family transcriptional regulator [Desulfovibrio sp. JC022]